MAICPGCGRCKECGQPFPASRPIIVQPQPFIPYTPPLLPSPVPTVPPRWPQGPHYGNIC